MRELMVTIRQILPIAMAIQTKLGDLKGLLSVVHLLWHQSKKSLVGHVNSVGLVNFYSGSAVAIGHANEGNNACLLVGGVNGLSIDSDLSYYELLLMELTLL